MTNNKIEDLSGKHFGLWEVLYRDTKKYKTNDVRWICKCECGTIKSVLGKYLRTGTSKSCGCGKRNDRTGQRFGRLIVLETLYGYNGYNRAVYKCRCDCGNVIYVKGAEIKTRKSCGCSRSILSKDSHCSTDETTLLGNTYGRLTVVEMLYNHNNTHSTYCKCQCSCGNIVAVRPSALTSGNTSSCGCIHSPSLLGKKFGKLRVIQEVERRNHQRWWKCKCDCGAEIEVTSYQLTSGHTKSCGCLRSEKVSSNEMLIGEYLSKNKILFQREKTFNDCKGAGNKKLRFDFYLPQYNLCIEYDGEQHYRPIKYFGGIEKYNTLKLNDNIKNKYCADHNIALLRLPFTFSKEQIIATINSSIQNPVTTTVV